MGVFRFLARVTIGLLCAGHGVQKLFSWFGGGGPEGTGQFFEQVGLRPGRRSAVLAGAAEAGGGLLFAFGAATPLGAAAAGAPAGPSRRSQPEGRARRRCWPPQHGRRSRQASGPRRSESR